MPLQAQCLAVTEISALRERITSQSCFSATADHNCATKPKTSCDCQIYTSLNLNYWKQTSTSNFAHGCACGEMNLPSIETKRAELNCTQRWLMPCLKYSLCARRARPSDAINTIFTLLLISYGTFCKLGTVRTLAWMHVLWVSRNKKWILDLVELERDVTCNCSEAVTNSAR